MLQNAYYSQTQRLIHSVISLALRLYKSSASANIHRFTVTALRHFILARRGGGAGLVRWLGGPLDASFGFYLRGKPNQHSKDIIQQESLGSDMLSELKNSDNTISHKPVFCGLVFTLL